MRPALSLILVLRCLLVTAQQKDTIKLETVLIQAYATGKPITEVAASVGYLGKVNLERFNNTSILPAVNTIPGVRMEERSPGSFRFSIRGSLLRSPFGVRNVKMYWNGLPLTDGGGNTYLNLIDFNAIGSMEVIKGPGGSLYGAGTGGVVLLKSPSIRSTRLEASEIIGSYGLNAFNMIGQVHSQKINARINYGRLSYNGYREQTSMRRDAINADITFQLDTKSALSTTLFYTDLTYETPGGLTQAQYDANPQQARPAGASRGAVEQHAAVFNKTPYIGLIYEHDWNEKWNTRVGIFGSRSNFKNSAIGNYEVREETNLGGRAETQYTFGEHTRKTKVTLGGEYQYFDSPINNYVNNYGFPGDVQTTDKLNARQMLLFAQADIHLPANFFLTLGSSINFLQYDFSSTFPSSVKETRTFNAFSPRIALLNKLTPELSLYASVSQGFSPPSQAELYPSRRTFNKTIESEQGINYEAGIKGAFNRSLNFDISAYNFQLQNTLAIRRDATLEGNPEYFINSGSTSQKGIEAFITWKAIKHDGGLISNLTLWNSYAMNHYRFNNFAQDTIDYSGNKLTGVPPTINTTGIDVSIKNKFLLNVTGTYVDHIPLNDANTFYANEYFILGIRMTYTILIHDKHQIEIFGGVDNALDKKYSLGNDLNAFGGRYFNAAAPRNYFGGLRYRYTR